MKTTRRTLIRRAAQAAVAAGAAGAVRAAVAKAPEGKPSGEAAMDAVIDTHQHLWDLTKFRLPWLKPGGKLTRSFVTKDYLEATRGLNVVKAVYMEVAVDPAQHLAEAEYVIALCKRKDAPTCAAVIGGRPGEEGFRKYITRFKASPYVKGVRQILPHAKARRGPKLDAQFIRGVRLLGELGMRFDLCMPPARLLDGAKLADQCPETRFVLDHCGNADPAAFRPGAAQAHRDRADQWRRDVAAVAKRGNVVCKISGIVARAPQKWSADDLAPIVNHCLEVFGPDRVMFASDWPVCTRRATLRRWLAALKQVVATRPAAGRRKLLHDNALAFYGLT